MGVRFCISSKRRKVMRWFLGFKTSMTPQFHMIHHLPSFRTKGTLKGSQKFRYSTRSTSFWVLELSDFKEFLSFFLFLWKLWDYWDGSVMVPKTTTLHKLHNLPNSRIRISEVFLGSLLNFYEYWGGTLFGHKIPIFYLVNRTECFVLVFVISYGIQR